MICKLHLRLALYACVLMVLFSGISAYAAPSIEPTPLIGGYHLLYNLDFDHAHQVFASWAQDHPEDPMGPVSEAAGYLFSEFNRLGVLESQFYTNDKQFDARKKLTPDPTTRDGFTTAITQAETRARAPCQRPQRSRRAVRYDAFLRPESRLCGAD